MKNIKEFVKKTDITILLAAIVCSGISIYAIYAIYMTTSALSSSRTAVVQLVASLIGIIAALVISIFDYKALAENFKLHSIVVYALMILTMFIGKSPAGTTNKAWIELPYGLSIQPSELLKLSMIVTLAYFIDQHKKDINEWNTLFKLMVISAIPLIFVAIQKDGGTLLIFISILIFMFFAAGISNKLVIGGIGSVIIGSPIIWHILDDYQKNRILGLFYPDDFSAIMWQQNMGKISIGSGMVFGKGFMSSNHNSTPLMYNDFIFSFIAESIGFVGMILLMSMLLGIFFRCLIIAVKINDTTGSLICVGVAGMFVTQMIINIGMNLSLLPVIGVTLPLLTAGGTSVVATYCALGLVLSVARHNKQNLF